MFLCFVRGRGLIIGVFEKIVNLPMPSQKSISRVHLIIEIGEVMEGDGVGFSSLVRNFEST